MYKALLGPRAAVYGDHVELTRITGADTDYEQDLGDDFASTLGTGGVLGTKFTWPDYGPKFKGVFLTPDKEAHWKQWISSTTKRCSRRAISWTYMFMGLTFRKRMRLRRVGMSTMPFMHPTSTATQNNGRFVKVERASRIARIGAQELPCFRLCSRKDYGVVTGPTAKLNVDFIDYLLLEATPAP